MRSGLTGLAAAGLLAVAAPAAADVRVIYDGGFGELFSVAMPDGWVFASGIRPGTDPDAPNQPRVIGMNPEDDLSIWLGWLSPPGISDLDAAIAYVEGVSAEIVTDPVVELSQDITVDGRPGHLYAGTGIRQDAPIDFGVAVIDMPGDVVVIGLFIGEFGAREVYQAEIDYVTSSFKVMGGP
ncbi:MAG: hypothetical protein AAFR46_17375 [Pseudomonadota bacterium]